MTKGQTVVRVCQSLIGRQQNVLNGVARRSVWPILAKHFSAPVAAEPFINGSSSTYVEEMYIAWQEDPKSVHKVIIPMSMIRKNQVSLSPSCLKSLITMYCNGGVS